MQDCRCHEGRVECLREEAGYEVRTASVLAPEIGPGDVPGHLRVVTGRLDDGAGTGVCGFLIGVGGNDLDYRAAALAQRGSGEGGGLLCSFEADGQARFRDHTSESDPLRFEPLAAQQQTDGRRRRRPDPDDEIALELDIVPRGEDRFDVELKAVDAASETPFSGTVRRNVPGSELRGGVSLVSSPPTGESRSRWWFEGFESAGRKITRLPERRFGPIAGTLYSLNDDVLKLSAQLLPVADRGDAAVELWYRPVESDGRWFTVPSARVDRGFRAGSRIAD